MLSFESVSDTLMTNYNKGGWGATQVDTEQLGHRRVVGDPRPSEGATQETLVIWS